jgi:hypothetical protein
MPKAVPLAVGAHVALILAAVGGCEPRDGRLTGRMATGTSGRTGRAAGIGTSNGVTE